MTGEEAIYCLKSYQPDSPDDMCLKCPYYGSIQVDKNQYICKSNVARDLAIKALENEKVLDDIKTEIKEHCYYACKEGAYYLDVALEIIDKHINR